MLDRVTKETFEPVTGEAFRLALDSGEAVRLELHSVTGQGNRGPGDREQFSLVFKGPASPILPQKIYRLEHDRLGTLDIFR